MLRQQVARQSSPSRALALSSDHVFTALADTEFTHVDVLIWHR